MTETKIRGSSIVVELPIDAQNTTRIELTLEIWSSLYFWDRREQQVIGRSISRQRFFVFVKLKLSKYYGLISNLYNSISHFAYHLSVNK